MNKLSDVFINSMWIGKIERPKLLAAISSLSADAQIALNMKFWERRSYTSISKRLGISEELAKTIVAETFLRLLIMLSDDCRHCRKNAA